MENVPASLYHELGVKPGVSPQKLRQAYRKSVMRYHPDTSSGNGNAKKFRQVTEAYQLLQKMNAYQSAHAGKKTVSRASNLRQKFDSEVEAVKYARRSIVSKNFIPKGTTLTEDLLDVKRPGTGISPTYFYKILGSVTLSDIPEDTTIQWDDISYSK